MRDLRAAIEALPVMGQFYDTAYPNQPRHTTICREDVLAILSAPEPSREELREKVKTALNSVLEPEGLIDPNRLDDLCDATLPLMPTSKRTVTLYREPQDAPIVREFLWLNHGCPISHLYGDDGEMQCSNGPHRPLDFKRQELPVLVRAILAARIEATKSAALPAPKRYRCRACEQEFDSKVGMHREHITDIDGSWCSGIVEEMP